MDILRDAFLSSDTVGKIIFLLIFPFLSALICARICSKSAFIRDKRTRDQEVQKRKDKARAAHLILGELERDQRLQGNLADLGREASQTLQDILRLTAQQRYAFFSEGTLPRPLTGEEVDRIMVAMENKLSKLERELEEDLHTIASIVTIAPLAGLFGTVWGVMSTFVGIVQNGGRPDIQAIAPGISGALLTTVVGLVVAIPGTWMNNFLLKGVQDRKRDMEEFCNLICASLSVAGTTSGAKPSPASAAVTPQPPPATSRILVVSEAEEEGGMKEGEDDEA